MSIAIPTLIEKDIRCGKARYQTYQTGMGGQSVLVVPDNSYIIIFGYDYSPAGGGLFVAGNSIGTATGQLARFAADIRPFETQQISFYTGQAFHPFIHHVDIQSSAFPLTTENNDPGQPNDTTTVSIINTIDNTPVQRQTYIISNRSVAITVGLISRIELNAASTIPVTDKTPPNLTYGGSTATPNVESIFSSNLANPPSFVQPSLKQFQDYGLGGVPGNAQDQAFALPDQTDGLIEPSQYLFNIAGQSVRETAGCNYFLNVHYALYTNTTPEALG
jgi:hypothetical protein